VANGSKFLGKPYEPNAIIKNDIEFILMQRKPGGYRKPTEEQRRLSMIPKDKFEKWFQQFWNITGASTKEHPAPFPLELALRLVQMFSFVGDIVLDPFCGTATTMIAALKTRRNSVGVEIDTDYCRMAANRLVIENGSLFSNARLQIELRPQAASAITAPIGALRETPGPYTATLPPKNGKGRVKRNR
jgi:site-specific DNA-methyltransferase (adenine-specific)